MCVRTKISYGCGHIYKTTNDCHESQCLGLQKFHIPKDFDCRSCKTAGDGVTRGREGKGRYARQISRRPDDNDRRPLSEISENIIPKLERLNIGSSAEPWGSPTKREKEWQSPTRRQADDAWLEEHEMRLADLESRHSGSQSPRFETSPSKARSRGQQRHDVVRTVEVDDYDATRRDVTEKALQYEVRSINDEHRSYPQSQAKGLTQRRRETDRRQDSYDSIDSLYRARSVARSHVYTTPTKTYTHDYYDRNDSGYGSYDSQDYYGHKPRRGYGAKTEPYIDHYYSTHQQKKVQPYVYEVPVSTAYGVDYQTGYGVDVVQRSPASSKHRRW